MDLLHRHGSCHACSLYPARDAPLPRCLAGVFTGMLQQHIHCQRSVQHALQVMRPSASGVCLSRTRIRRRVYWKNTRGCFRRVSASSLSHGPGKADAVRSRIITWTEGGLGRTICMESETPRLQSSRRATLGLAVPVETRRGQLLRL